MLELGELLVEPGRVDLRSRHTQDLRVFRGADRLVGRPQLLVELLAGERAGELDLDVAVGLETG